MTSTNRLEITDLACGYGDKALFRGLTTTLNEGSIARVLGVNGSGKTTLLRTVAGLHEALAGTVHWRAPARADGEVPRRRDDVCFVGHDNALAGDLTAVENLDMLLRLAGRRVPTRAIGARLAALGLKRARHRAVGRLSAGQRRRVSLARLWLTAAPLWLLDEPASALDVDARAALGQRIAAHAAAGGIVLFTTHEALPGVAPRAIELPAC